MYVTDSLQDLESKDRPPTIRIHKLTRDRKGQTAVDIDIDKISGWRIVFVFKNNKFFDVEIVNYH